MTTTQVQTAVTFKNILYLTDFSEPSEAALPFATAIARNYGSAIHALHVLTPVIPESCTEAIKADEELADVEMQKIDSQLAGIVHDTAMARGMGVWPALEQAITEHSIDLIVLGTHGRTGTEKLLLGSTAEEIFRRSPVPVLTIGPDVRSAAHSGGHFYRVLLATDFAAEAKAAAPYAVSLAEENQAYLLLVHVTRRPERDDVEGKECLFDISVAEAMHGLYESIPSEVSLSKTPEAIVKYGDPADQILAVARNRGADLIVLGVRAAAGHMGAATHLERATAHKVVAHSHCPVLTVRG